jgi:tol-pal system protein YbgF
MHKKMKEISVSWVVLITAGLILWGGCATQDDLVKLNNRVIALERRAKKEREALRSDQKSQTQDSRSRDAELRAVIDEMRDEMTQLRGALEEDQHGADQWRNRAQIFEESLQGLEDRLVRLELYLGIRPSDEVSTSDTDQDESAVEPKTPEALYDRAKQLFDKGEYESAREDLRSFLKEYPKSKTAGDAQFLLGEIYFHEKWYEKAILEYQKVIEDYPKSDKTPNALLKQGFAFFSLGDEANARLILKELIRKFPDSEEANIAQNKLKTVKQ